MKTANKIIMTLAGLLLIVAAGLKFYEMIDTCIPSWDVKTQAVITAAQKAGEQMPAWKANTLGFWESYESFLIQIPLEFALGVWLVSGLFRKGSWIVGTLAYFFFIFVTIGKWVTGAKSCGCFGPITVDPKITLFAMDIPIFLMMLIFRPKGYKLLPPPWPKVAYMLAVAIPVLAVMALAAPAIVTLQPDCIEPKDTQPDESAKLRLQIHKLKQGLSEKQQEIETLKAAVTELKQTPRTTDKKAFIGVLEIIATDKPNFYEIHIGGKQTLILNAENLETIYLSVRDMGSQKFAITEAGQVEMNWIAPEPTKNGTDQPIPDANDTPPVVEKWEWLQYVVEDEVREQLTEGLVVVMIHRHDCPTCEEMAPRYSEYYAEMADQGVDEFKIAFLAVPPYHEDEDTVPDDTPCILGKLTDEKKWGLMSPLVVALLDGE
ncbi:MAG: hypothetical protein ABFR90_09955, partial [Planctomycetota bacterium]